MSEIIKEFLIQRKEAKIKDKIKAGLDEAEKQAILDELEEQFAPQNWISDAAKRASQLTIASHPSKFSHPDAKTTSIIANVAKNNDGYLRSGNVDCDLDVFGNAAALDVYKFLNLKLSDGNSILHHFEQDSAGIKTSFCEFGLNYLELKKEFLAIKESQSSQSSKTDRLVKQVYFPIGQDYHQLSILTNSGLVTKVKKQIDEIRFAEKNKEAKEARKKNEFYKEGEGFDDILDLTVMKYGGTKPQNISILNNQNGGRAYLLPCLPPKFEKREFLLPTYDFFENVLQIKDFKIEFLKLAKLIKDSRNNIAIREYRHDLIDNIITKVLEYVISIKNNAKSGWSNDEKYRNLPKSQKIWLDNFNEDKRDLDQDWSDEISHKFAEWIIETYQNLHKKSYETLGEAEFIYIREESKNAIL